jgi:hypothetical protein
MWQCAIQVPGFVDVQEDVDRLARTHEHGVGRVTFHSLRHTALSRLANHPSIPLVYVRDFAGHSTLATTETDVHKLESAETTAAAVLAMAGTSGTSGTYSRERGGLTGMAANPFPRNRAVPSPGGSARRPLLLTGLKQPLIVRNRLNG